MIRNVEQSASRQAVNWKAAAAHHEDGAMSKPALHTFGHGEFQVSVVSDGHLVLPTSLLAPDAPRLDRIAVLESGGATEDDYRPAANVTLLRSSRDLILFDTGGLGYQPQLGRLAHRLAAAGIDPAAVTKVVFTHGHPDHVGGTLLADGALTFPNAAYYSGATEWDFWTGEDVWTKLPSSAHPFVVNARRQYDGVRDRVTMIREGDDIVSGVRAIDTPGHTPGHLSFEVAGGEGLIIVGDVVTAPWVYFPHPEWKFGFDGDHETAISSRKRLLDRAASDRIKMLGYHWAYPGIGYAERHRSGYRYIAAA